MSNLIPLIVSWDSIYEPPKNTAIYENIFPTPLMLDPYKTYGLALESINTYYSFPNIRDGVNNKFTYTKSGVETTLYLPTGCYDITTINSTIQNLMGADSNNIVISTIVPQLKSQILIKANFTVDFTKPNSINNILGFNSKILNTGTHISDEIVNINNTNSLFINCDLISESYVNGSFSPVIYSFFPNAPPGHKIVQELPRLNFIRVNKNQINSIKLWITNQDNELVDFRGETITLRFYLGEIV